MKKKKNVRVSTMQILVLGFLGVVFLGGFLLWLPICNTQPIKFVDALFTSTTAVCVTGLVTVTPATQFTILGQIILLVLIQIGGLGIIACSIGFFLILKKKISVKERVVIQEAYGMDTLTGMVKLIIRVVTGTFLVEGIGAFLYAFQFIPEYGMIKGIWYSVFHAVSAFCNAGIDILGGDSFIKYATNPIINITTMGLIIVSGIGFIVWHDLKINFQNALQKKVPFSRVFTRLRLHSKIAISVTAILIVFGTVNFLLMEYSNPGTFGTMTFGQKLMAGAFHSVSTRTAGFATVPQSALKAESMLVTCVLMFIGGSPGGTAGGVKTTTIAMLVLTCITVLRGGRDTECFGRKIAPENIRTGFAVVSVSFCALLLGTIAVTALESNVEFMRILYETTSAIGTVGLSADLTPHLGTASKYVIMAMMYLGRIGPITLALAFGERSNPRDKVRELPVRRILVG